MKAFDFQRRRYLISISLNPLEYKVVQAPTRNEWLDHRANWAIEPITYRSSSAEYTLDVLGCSNMIGQNVRGSVDTEGEFGI